MMVMAAMTTTTNPLKVLQRPTVLLGPLVPHRCDIGDGWIMMLVCGRVGVS